MPRYYWTMVRCDAQGKMRVAEAREQSGSKGSQDSLIGAEKGMLL